MVDNIQIVMCIIGGLAGMILGYFVGKFRIYYYVNKNNTINISENPETERLKEASGKDRLLLIVVGLVLIVGGGAILLNAPVLAGVSPQLREQGGWEMIQAAGKQYAGGGLMAGLGGFLFLGAIFGEVKVAR